MNSTLNLPPSTKNVTAASDQSWFLASHLRGLLLPQPCLYPAIQRRQPSSRSIGNLVREGSSAHSWVRSWREVTEHNDTETTEGKSYTSKNTGWIENCTLHLFVCTRKLSSRYQSYANHSRIHKRNKKKEKNNQIGISAQKSTLPQTSAKAHKHLYQRSHLPSSFRPCR